MMTKDSYRAMLHHFHKKMKDIEFPTTKDSIIKKIGQEKVLIDYDKDEFIANIINPIKLNNFTSAAEFYCALFSTF